MKDVSMKELKNKATEMRMKVVDMIYKAQSGHPGGSLSAADFMTACYFKYMNVDPKNPQWEDRDRMVLSKGHVCPIQYACLGTLGFFPEEELDTLRQEGSKLQGHPSMNKCPGIDISTGSLGQGLACAVGMALAGKMNKKNYRVYTVMGDGELAEGSVWEAAMAGHQYKLDNLCAIVDRNRLQISGNTEDVMGHDDLHERFKSFGWHVIDVADGNSIEQLHAAFEEAKQTKGQPTVLIANTVKGKGSAVMEDKAAWHHHVPTQEEYEQIMKDFEERKEQL